jgi:hypothetical protein
MIPFFLALAAIAFPAMGQTNARDCGPDVWAKLFSRRETASEEYGQLLAKVKRGLPPTPEQRELLFQEILELPDASNDAARSVLKQIEELVEQWHNPQRPAAPLIETAALTRAVALRKLISGGADALLAAKGAILCIDADSSWFPRATSPDVWKNRIETALIKHGEENLWGANYTDPNPSPLDNTLFTLAAGTPKADRGRQSEILANVVKTLSLNPSAKSHRMALTALIKAAETFSRYTQRRPEEPLDYPVGIVQALTGYIDPNVFPPEKRDPAIEQQIRELLPKMRIRFEPDHFDEFPPRVRRRTP